MVFKNPHLLWGLLLAPSLLFFLFLRGRKVSLETSFARFFPKRKTSRIWLLFLSKTALVVSLGLLIVALARPQKGYIEEKLITEGIDIVLAVDVSSSMKAEDFKPNRLGAAKSVAKEFIEGRKNDKIGLVVFSRKAITQSPLTIDYTLLYNFLDTIEIGMIPDGTAIGNAIAEGAKRLLGGKELSKVLILLTDGVNNSGEVDPITAAQAAMALNIKIYTIGVGSMGKVPYPVDDPVFGKRYVSVPVQIDEAVLKEIADRTGGKYFRATDTEKLAQIYKEIDSLEKSRIEITQYKRTKEWYVYPLGAGMLLLAAHLFLSKLIVRIIP